MTDTLDLVSMLGSDMTVVGRQRNPYASTSPSEVVTCRLGNGAHVRVFCKYPAAPDHRAFGHRGDAGYEAMVYREVVAPSGLSAPRFFGESINGGRALLIEVIDGAKCADQADSPTDAMALSARWIGRFHAANQTARSSLIRYDAAYYALWPRRTSVLAGHWHHRHRWLAGLCRRAEQHATVIANELSVVIHGEFTPHNVLIRKGVVYPVDWESAAVALGEIDLACLTDKWPAAIAERCEAEYQAARWPDGETNGFAHRLDLARFYWDFRWLGDRPEWTGSEKVGPRLDHLRGVAERLGLL